MSSMRTTQILENVFKNINGDKILVIEDGFFDQSLSVIVTGNGTTEILPALGNCMCRKIKAICIIGNGNTGTAKLLINTTVVLPVYFSVMSKGNTTPSLRLNVPSGENVTLITENRSSSDETFVGITYYNTNE